MSRDKKADITEKKCDYCLKGIPLEAVRCPLCTTWLDWDACTKASNMKRIAAAALPSATAGVGAGILVGQTEFVDYPAPAQAPAGHF
jgi:hypothetical protein